MSGMSVAIPMAEKSASMTCQGHSAVIPEDRRRQGLVQDFSVQENLLLAHLGRQRGVGLGYDELRLVNPALVYMNMAAFGSAEGPYRTFRTWGANLSGLAGLDEQVVGPEAGDGPGVEGGDAVADLHHRDHRRHADDDAQRGEQRAHAVGAQRRERDAEVLDDDHRRSGLSRF